MHIQDFVDRVLLIDNKDNEIEELAHELRARDIDVGTYNPSLGEEPEALSKNRQLIFVDLMLDEDVNHRRSNLSQLLSILSKVITQSFGNYGLILWTKHPDEEAAMLKQMISELAVKEQKEEHNDDDEIEIALELRILPMFIVTLSKNTFIEKGSYEGVLDAVEQELRKSNAGYFFMRWIASVKTAMDKTVSDVYSLCKDYVNHESKITYLLHTLAVNHTGSPHSNLSVDCYKSFDELLYANLFCQLNNEQIPVFEGELPDPWADNKEIKKRIFSSLNSKFFIDMDGIQQDLIAPGNVYKLKGDWLKYKVKEKVKTNKDQVVEPYDSIDIAIELTPPCDFSNKKISSRIIVGYAFKQPTGLTSKENKYFGNELKADNKYVMKNLLIEGEEYILIFEYRYLYTPSDDNLKSEDMFELWFRAKPKLFADILQKFSSHAARLGLSDIH